MSVDPYGTRVKAIKDSLVDIVEGTTSFQYNTSADYVVKVPNPGALIRLRRDVFADVGPMETHHLTLFEIQINFIGTHREATLDSIIDYVGEVVDAIEADRTLSNSNIENTEVTNVEFTRTGGESAVRHVAIISVQVESLRNV